MPGVRAISWWQGSQLIKRTYNPKCLCTHYQNLKLHKANSDWTEKEKIVKCTIPDGDFKSHHSIVDITSRQVISKDIENLNNTINKLDLVDIYRTLPPVVAGYTSFSSIYQEWPYSDHKTSLNKFQRIQIL